MTAKTLFVNDKALRISELICIIIHQQFESEKIMSCTWNSTRWNTREYCITLNTQDPCKSKGFICILSLPIAFLSFNK